LRRGALRLAPDRAGLYRLASSLHWGGCLAIVIGLVLVLGLRFNFGVDLSTARLHTSFFRLLLLFLLRGHLPVGVALLRLLSSSTSGKNDLFLFFDEDRLGKNGLFLFSFSALDGGEAAQQQQQQQQQQLRLGATYLVA